MKLFVLSNALLKDNATRNQIRKKEVNNYEE